EAVVFLSTTGDVLDASQQAAFESYIRSGGGFVGVHAAADTEYDWPFYGDLVGAYFASHPLIQAATVQVEDRTHPATSHLDATWRRTDEWYNYKTNVRSTARVLATLDESSYSGGTMGDHPTAWCKDFEGGRSFYTGGGHTRQSYAEPAFRAHLLGGIRYAAGAAPADCRPASTNLARGRPATADSSCRPSEGPDKAVNGSVSGGNADKWCSRGTAKWWRVDLQSPVQIGRVVVHHAAAGGEPAVWNTRDFDIETSTDATTWTTISQTRANTAAVTTHTVPATTARYVRLAVLTATSTANTAARVYEVEVYAR
ncbi:MAG TPA: ThuA domain-containing protein, partial [Kribbellaceae bacterium]